MPVLRIELMRPTRREYLAADDLYETAWEECARETFAKAWAEEEEQARNHVDTETIRLATGLLLPIWSALPSTHLAVSRIVDAEGRSWLGRIVFPGDLHQLFGKLGLSEETSLTPSEIARAVENGNVIPLKRPFACEIKRARVNGLPRIEIVGAPAGQLAWLKSLGCFTEVIAYKTRVFVPVPEATVILQRVLGDR